MRRFQRVFLSGPDGLMPDGADLLAAKRALCAAAGLEGVHADPQAGRDLPGELAARTTYAEALALLRGCDAVVANLTPWRGPHPESGAVFEVGFASALGLPVFAYLNVADEGEIDARDRVAALVGAALDTDGQWRDPDGGRIDDHGLPEHPLIWAEARSFYAVVTPDPLSDVTGVELCLEALRAYAD